MLGMNLVVPFLPFFVRELGVVDDADVALWSGIAFSGTFLSAFIATPFWGILGDKYGRKAMVIRAIFGLALSQVIIGLSQDVYQLVAFRVLQGGISGFIASSLALVATNTPRDRIGYALGVLQSSTASGMVLGPLVGGLLADHIGYRSIFFITALLCGAGGIVVLTSVRETSSPVSGAERFTVSDNIRLMYRNRQLAMVGICLVVAQMAVLMIEPIFALFVESFNVETEYLSTLTGAIFSIAGVFMIVSAPGWGRRNDRFGQRRNLTFALAGASAAYAGHMFVANLFQLGILRAFLGFARGAVLPGLYSLVSLHAPVERRGGIMAIASSLTLLGNSAGPLLGGFTASRFGIRTSFMVASTILLLLSFVVWRTFTDKPANIPGSHQPLPEERY